MKRKSLSYGIVVALLLSFLCGSSQVAAHHMSLAAHHAHSQTDDMPKGAPIDHHGATASATCIGGVCATMLSPMQVGIFAERATTPKHVALILPPLGRAPLPEPNPPRV